MLIDVKPGMVLISFSSTLPPSRSTKASTRASPQQSTARKAATPSLRTSWVVAWSSAAGIRSSVLLSVTDRGCGIPENRLGEIFEPFFSTKGEQGHGLGLAAVLSVAEGHGGRVEVDSKVGVGSTFRVILPAAES